MKTIIASCLAAVLAVTAGCAQAEQPVDNVKLRMAKALLLYVDTCPESRVPDEYITKAKQIWNAAPAQARSDTEQALMAFFEKSPAGFSCWGLAYAARIVVAGNFNSQPIDTAPQKRGQGLTAKITRIERSTGGHFYPLIVVDNQSNESYTSTNWSCTFYSKDGEPVHEDTFYVKNVRPSGQTAHKSISQTNAAWETVSCRLLDAD